MIKFKTCEVMQYFEYYDVVEIGVIEQRIKKLTNIKRYAIIIHDKDLLENGQPKKKHFHCILTFSNSTNSKLVSEALKVEEQYVNKIRTTTKSAMLYLVHKNNPEKYQYNAEDVSANFDYIEYVDDCEPKQNRVDIAKKIESGEIKMYNLIDYISVDEYSKNKGYYDKCFDYRTQKIKNLNRSLNCIFVTGSSGSGKTTFAKDYATKKGYSVYISSGGSNLLDDYKGQDCIILDDLRDSIFTFDDFLKLTDNNTNSLVGCRFYNKSIYECKLIIITSCVDLYDFYADYFAKTNEPKVQLFRRFSLYIKMDYESITMYSYNNQLQDFTYSDCYENYIYNNFCKNSMSSFINDIGAVLGLIKKPNYQQVNLDYDVFADIE